MTAIQKQRNLMQTAIKTLAEIETIQTFIGPVDPIISKMMARELQEKYADTMAELLRNLLMAAPQTVEA